MNHESNNILSTSLGAYIADDNNSMTTRDNPATVLNDVELMEKQAHFNRERIPERVVHAKGAGAHGVFTVTNDLTKYCCADFLSCVGKRTEVFARFSTVGGEKGSADTARDPRGFAVKFYTEEGNYDIVGNNTPIFFIRDAIKFPDFIHSQKKNPMNNLTDYDAFWDFLSLTPESVFQVLRLMSDYGTPDGFRFMDGFGTNTFVWYNKKKDYYFVKYTWKSNQGIKNLTRAQAEMLAGKNPDYAVEDLYSAIARKEFPSWTLFVQIMTKQEAENYKYDIFDVTKVVYEKDFPLIEVGVMELNRAPKSFFTEVEQAAFCPGNIVNGIDLSPDKMLNARAVLYSDAQRYRIGTNFAQLPINSPKNKPHNYQRAGAMQTSLDNEPNYFPNSYNGPQPMPSVMKPMLETMGPIARYGQPVREIDYEQPRYYYEKELTKSEKENLIANIIDHLSKAVKRIQYRQAAVFNKVSKDLGEKVAMGLDLDYSKVEELSLMSDEERAKATQRN